MASKQKIEKSIKAIYQKILLREPDRFGFDYYVSQVIHENLTLQDVEQQLSNSEEGTSIKNFSHYSDKYWNDLLPIQKYKNNLATGNENTSWLEDLPSRFKNSIPFKKVLIVGCGNGWLERELFDMNIGLEFDAFDISDEYLKESNQKKGNRNITYFKDDINNLQNLKTNKYDAIFNFAILHHATEIDSALKNLSQCLKSGGLMFNEEYVGPARNQYSDEQLQLMVEVNSDLPEVFRTKHLLRPPLANFRVEPSEAIHSDLVVSTFKKYFDIVYERNMNGGIAYQILWNNVEHFMNYDDPKSKKWLNYLLERDIYYSNQKRVPVMFWYGVGTSKNK